ncbi:MAG: two-component regulator propeller domain-containing protein [Marinoscillum sp.]
MDLLKPNLILWITFIGIVRLGFGLSKDQADYRFKHFNTDHGLSQVTILSLYEDEQGYIWIGTGNGLNYFDGYDFHSFYGDPWNQNTLSSNYINVVTGDGKGTIWIGTSDGLTSYDQRKKIFTRFYPNEIADEQPWTVLSLLVDRDGNLWVSSGRGLYLLKAGSTELKKVGIIKESGEVLDDYFIGSVQTMDDNLWFGGTNGLLKLVDRNGQPALQRIEIKKGADSLGSVNALFQDRSDELWISGSTHVWRLKLSDLTTDVIENVYPIHSISTIFETREGFIRPDEDHLWVATYHGPMIIDTKTYQYTGRLEHDPDNPLSLSDNSIHSMLVTSRGDVWLGSYSSGLNYYSRHQNVFEVFRNSPINVNSLNSDIINCFLEGSDSILFVGTSRGGLNIWDRRKSIFTYEQESLNVRHLLLDGDDLWIGSYFDGLIKKSLKSGQYTFYKNNETIDFVVSRYSTMLDDDGNLWAAAWNSIYKYQRATDTFERFEIPVKTPNGFRIIWQLLQYGEDLWIISNSGIHVFNLPSYSFVKHYAYDAENKNSLPTNDLDWGIKDRKGRIWIASKVGLSYFEPETETFHTLTPADGLPSNMVVCLLADDDNNIWVSTAKGLAVLDQESMTFRSFSKSNNLQSMTFRSGSCYACQDGSLLFGGSNGFNRIDPKHLPSDPNPPNLIINDLAIFNKSIQPGAGSLIQQDIRYLDTLRIPFDQNVFTLTFSAIDFLDPEKSEYAYMMEPFEKEWNEVGNKRTATYTNLKPGTYTFKVKASNGDGIWAGQPKQLTVIVVPPFWLTVWFRLLMVLLFLGLIYLVYYIRMRQHRFNHYRLKQMVHERTRELSEANKSLEEKNHEIHKQSEELQAQRDSLEETLLNLQKTQSQLIESAKMASIGTLTAGLAHELNNPLNYIGGMTGPIRKDLKEIKERMIPENRNALNEVFDEMESLLDSMTNGVSRAATIVRNLLNISPHGSNQKKDEEFELNNMVTATLSFIEKSAPDIGFSIQLEGSLTVTGNKVEVNQVLINLVTNGIDAVRDKADGRIQIIGKTVDKHVILEVKDNGLGFPKELEKQIFEPFFTTKPPGSGTGLGLFISYSIIKKHQGDLLVDSTVGKGSTFTILLPVSF